MKSFHNSSFSNCKRIHSPSQLSLAKLSSKSHTSHPTKRKEMISSKINKDFQKNLQESTFSFVKSLWKACINSKSLVFCLHLQGNFMILCCWEENMLEHELKLEIKAKIGFFKFGRNWSLNLWFVVVWAWMFRLEVGSLSMNFKGQKVLKKILTILELAI